MKRSVFTAGLLVLMTCTVIAEDPSSEQYNQYFEIPFSELFDLPTKTVTKTEQSGSSSPGVVSTVTSEEILNLGFQTVQEVLAYVAGIYTYDSYFTQFNQLAIRGNISAEQFNSKVLFMVNGHPIFNINTGGFEVNSIPLLAIDRIEVVRGPVSVIYGTNALSGVINIITRKNLGKNDRQLSYQTGSFSTREARALVGDTHGDFSYSLAATQKNQDGYLYTFDPDQDEAGVGGSHRQFDNTSNVLASLSYKNFEVDLAWWQGERPGKLGVIPNSTFLIPRWNQKYYYMDARYKHQISDGISLNAALRLDEHDLLFDNNNSNQLENSVYGTNIQDSNLRCFQRGRKAGVEVYSGITALKDLSATVGVSYDRYFDAQYFCRYENSGISRLSPFLGRVSNYDLAVYSNNQYNISESVSFVLGGRFTENKITGNNVNYRTGLVSKLGDQWTVKALWGTSYRSPSIAEVSFASGPIITGDPDLDFETLRGADLSLVHHSENIYATLTYFWNETDKFITRVPQETGGPIYANTEGTRTQGIEIDAKLRVLENASLFVNGSYLVDTEDLSTGEDLLAADAWMTFGGSISLLDQRLVLSNFNRLTSDWGAADGFFQVNLSARWTPPIYNDRVELYFVGNNLTDQEHDYAEFVRRNIDTISGTVPISFLAGARLKF